VDSGLIQSDKVLQILANQVSILISVDSGLILDLTTSKSEIEKGFNPYFSGFRSYTGKVVRPDPDNLEGFNPYFSGFRSYTNG